MKQAMVRAMVFSIVIATVSSVASGQHEVAANLPGSQVSRAAAELLARRVTVDVQGVSLKRAIEAVAGGARVLVQYRSELVERYSAPVSVRVVNGTLGDALERVLMGTDLRVIPDGPSQLVLVQEVRGVRQGTILGKVIDTKTKQPIRGATVFLNTESKGITTGEDGVFRLTVPAGEHLVTVRVVGMMRQSKRITVDEEGTILAEFVLEPSASVLDEVIVTGTVVATERKAIPNPIIVITSEDIERRGIARIEELFRGDIPGVVALERGSYGYASNQLGAMAASEVYARGPSTLDGGTNPLKTYVDGVELSDPSYLGLLDPKNIERIEIVTGPQAATIYGSGAIGGVMQIFTKKGAGAGARPDVVLALKYGMIQNSVNPGKTPSHQHSLSIAGGAGPSFSYSATASYNYTGQWVLGLFNRQYGASVGLTHTGESFGMGGSVSTTYGSNGSVDTCCNSPLIQEMMASGQWGRSSSARDNPSQVSTSVGQTVAANIDYRPMRFWRHHLSVGKSQHDFDLIPATPRLRSPSDTMFEFQSATGARITGNYNSTLVTPPFRRIVQTLTVGMNLASGRGSSSAGEAPLRSATTIVPWTYGGLSRSEDKSWGGFGSLQAAFFNRVFLTLGLRGEHSPSYGRERKIDWTPSNGLALTLERGELTLKLLGSYGRATRIPGPNQREEIITCYSSLIPGCVVSQQAALMLTPEYSRGPQGGLELYYGNKGALSVNRYTQSVKDLIQYGYGDDSTFVDYVAYPGNPYWYRPRQYQNTASIRQHGWEFNGSFNISAFTVKGSYSWSDSRVTAFNPAAQGGYAYYVGMSFLRVPTHFGGGTITYARGGLNASLTTNWMGAYASYGARGDILVNDRQYSRLTMYTVRARSSVLYSIYPRASYTRIHFSALQRINPWASATLNISNLGNSYGGTEGGGLYPGLGRQSTVGLSLRRR